MSEYATKQRKILLDFLSANADCPVSVSDILSSLKKDNISMSAIYRNLSSLEDEGKIQRLTVGNSRKVYYRYTGAKECEEHLHLSCFKCGKTFHMDIPDTNTLIDNVLSGSGFKVDSANTVLYGVCGKCTKGHSKL